MRELVREPLSCGADPLAVAGWLSGQPRPVALSGAWLGGGLVLSSDPVCVASPDADPFALLQSVPVGATGLLPAIGGKTSVDGPIGGGWIGWLGFGLGRVVEPTLGPPPPRPVPLPPFDLAFHDHVVRLDAGGRWWFEALWSEARSGFLEQRLGWWRERLAGGGAPPAAGFESEPLRVVGAGDGGHCAAVAEAIARIHAGELSQANICLRLEGGFRGDPLSLWLRATRAARPAYSAFVGAGDHAVVSLSPELFLRRRGREVVTRPIKGTAPLDTDPRELETSAKDRAENVMIVDLMRNDLGRVCEYGSVGVDALCEVEPAAGVWHLVSTVRGRLRRGVGDAALLRATFPPGSVSGAPKVQALRVIGELESTAREAYCGAIGICSPLAGLELNVAIRTFELAGGRIWLGAGGGVVADSVPAAEVDEALRKARGVADAGGVPIADTGRVARAARLPGPLVRLRRPDPGWGVIGTLRAAGGVPVQLAEHLARLRASCAALGLNPPAQLARLVERAAAEVGEGAVRIRVAADGVEVETRGLPGRGPVALEPVVLPGGLGAHKWADRRLVEALSSPGSTPLLCDLDGVVLEAGYAAVLIVTRGIVVAPPLDGRVLPSISRANALAAARRAGLRVALRPVSIDAARTADAIVLTSSLRGPHPGVLAGGPAAEASQAVCEQIAGARAAADSQ